MARIDRLRFYVSTPTRGYFVEVKRKGEEQLSVSILGPDRTPAPGQPSIVLYGDPKSRGTYAHVSEGGNGTYSITRYQGDHPTPEPFPPESKVKVGDSTVWFLEAVMEGGGPARYCEELVFSARFEGRDPAVRSARIMERGPALSIGSNPPSDRPGICLKDPHVRGRHAALERGAGGELTIVSLGATCEVLAGPGVWKEFNSTSVQIGTVLRFGQGPELELLMRLPILVQGPRAAPEDPKEGQPGPGPAAAPPAPPPDLSFKAALIRAGRRGIAQAVRWARAIEKAES